MLSNRHEPILYFVGGTYPRWPTVPNNFFHRYYRPTEHLLRVLPWSVTNPPQTVVHLFGTSDNRRQIDFLTLNALGKNLPRDAYLLTDRREWNLVFSDAYGWTYPSMLRERNSTFLSLIEGNMGGDVSNEGSRPEDNILRKWSDWYTILCANQVYHNANDLAESAVHWNNVWGKIIQGSRRLVDANKKASYELILKDEYWREGPSLPRIMDRTKKELKDCRPITNRSYIVFRDVRQQYQQGFGNIISGLLAAHLLALELNRTVCVSQGYREFHVAFEPTLPSDVVEECKIMEDYYHRFPHNSFELLNFISSVDECELKRRLQASSVSPVIYYTGNTYPRWPDIPDNFFHQHYKPTQRLLDYLPWKDTKPPNTVVHLRQGDRDFDQRKGLDNETLHSLGKNLPNDTYLVTNRVEWYKLFKENYGWRHPPWSKVSHSAGLLISGWGGDDAPSHISDPDMSTLQTWADWYTILCSHYVYHTFSDFSASAVHWNNLQGKVIKGSYRSVDGNNRTRTELDLIDEYWIGQSSPRLLDRSDNEMKDCRS